MLPRAERFRLRSSLARTLREDDWDFETTNLLLNEFGLASFGYGPDEPTVADLLVGLSDELLLEMFAAVVGLDADEVSTAVATPSSIGNWKPSYVRVFLSHSAAHKEFVGAVASDLAAIGIHGFVAHDTMEYSRPWQLQIEAALRSMQAFVAIVHPEFNNSAWCHQEVGWAIGRDVERFAVRMGADPTGFLGRDQWPSRAARPAKEVAATIAAWVTGLPDLGQRVFDGLFRALAEARNFFDAEAAAQRIVALGRLSDEAFDRLDSVWWANDQLFGSVLATRVMKPFYLEHNRAWPPPKSLSIP